MKFIKILLVLTLAVLSSNYVKAQKTSSNHIVVKAIADIGLTDAMSLSSAMNLSDKKSSVQNYVLELGYRFWTKNNMGLEVNAGLGYGTISNRLGIDNLQFSYNAGPDADMDGNSYVRHYEVDGIRQTVDVKSFIVPVYLSYNIGCLKWLTFHVDAGIRLRFNTSSAINKSYADFNTFGIYPEYDDLKIDAEWLNDFGHHELGDAQTSDVKTFGFNTELLFGVGLEFKLTGLLSLDLGIRYNYGLQDIYKNLYSGTMSSSPLNAPITYTVTEGEIVKPLSRYLTKSKLSDLSLRAGLVFRF